MARTATASWAWSTAVSSTWPIHCATAPFASSPHAEPSLMKDADTMKTMPKRAKSSKTADSSKTDWSRFDAMTEAQRHKAALNDPDARPLTEEDLTRMKRTPQARII